ncbi:MAG: hypothetical protein FOGNACKC_01944 [Anaerolineae bacterium]|nr:hypothetical protein [Anaerolineae bacterium]
MPHRYARRVELYDWLGDADLRNINWQEQPEVEKVLNDWFEAWYRRLFLEKSW